MRNSRLYPICPAAPVTATRMGFFMFQILVSCEHGRCATKVTRLVGREAVSIYLPFASGEALNKYAFSLGQACPERSRRAQAERLFLRNPFVLSLSKHGNRLVESFPRQAREGELYACNPRAPTHERASPAQIGGADASRCRSGARFVEVAVKPQGEVLSGPKASFETQGAGVADFEKSFIATRVIALYQHPAAILGGLSRMRHKHRLAIRSEERRG